MTDLRWPWLAVALGVVTVGLLVLWWLRVRAPRGAVLVARTSRLRALPRYRALTRRELALAVVATLGTLLVAGGAILVAARPTTTQELEPDRTARDIQLCLDVSRSMDRWNREVVAAFEQLTGELTNERIGLTIFSGAALTVLPLTDDYEYVRQALTDAEEAFRTNDYDYFVGAESADNRASQLGDGLASCLQRFDGLEERRGRAVVLASDNDPVGRPVFSPAEAAQRAARDEVVVYGLGTPNMTPDGSSTFEAAVEATGGSLTILGQGDVGEVVEGIQRLERTRIAERPEVVTVDDPEPALSVVVVGVVLLLGAVVGGSRR